MPEALDEQVISELAATVRHAEDVRKGTSPLIQRHPHLTIEDAYRVQRVNIERRLAAGEVIVGRKIGLTSRAMQRQLGVDEPDYGAITDRMVVPNGGSIALSDHITPKLEPEFAFRLGADLGTAPTLDEVRNAVAAVAVSIEVIDSRIADWRIGLADTIADNASSARIVTGDWATATPELLDGLPATTIHFLRGMDVVNEGQGSAVLGDPLIAVHWLATALGTFDETLHADDIILAGSVCAAVPLLSDDIGSEWTVTAAGFSAATVTIR